MPEPNQKKNRGDDDRAKEALVEVIQAWVTAFPALAEAHEAFALALEDAWQTSNVMAASM